MKEVRAESGRNYGIDVLRLFSAFLIIVLHVMGQGGVVEGARGINRWAAHLLYVPAYCAVDCFALISGYVGYRPRRGGHRYARYMLMWLQVVFYNLLVNALYWVVRPGSFQLRELVQTFTPVTSGTYWYFSAYTGVFFLIPWLNRMVERADGGSLKRLMLTILVLFSGYATLARPFSDPFGLGNGYSFAWLLLLYLVGAWMKKEDIPARASGKRAALWGAALYLGTWLSRFLIAAIQQRYAGGGRNYEYILLSYCSPTILGLAVALMILFSKLPMRGVAAASARFLAPAAFGVYLFHGQPHVFQFLIRNRYRAIGSVAAWQLPLLVWAVSLGIFALGLIADKARGWLFQVLRLPRLCDRVEARARRAANRVLSGGGR